VPVQLSDGTMLKHCLGKTISNQHSPNLSKLTSHEVHWFPCTANTKEPNPVWRDIKWRHEGSEWSHDCGNHEQFFVNENTHGRKKNCQSNMFLLHHFDTIINRMLATSHHHEVSFSTDFPHEL